MEQPVDFGISSNKHVVKKGLSPFFMTCLSKEIPYKNLMGYQDIHNLFGKSAIVKSMKGKEKNLLN